MNKIIKKIREDNKGSIALIGILIISAVLMILVLAMSEANITSALRQTNEESQKITYYGAEACMEEAMIRLKKDPGFKEGTVYLNEEKSCGISVLNNTATIEMTYMNYERQFEIEFELTSDGHANNIKLLNRREI